MKKFYIERNNIRASSITVVTLETLQLRGEKTENYGALFGFFLSNYVIYRRRIQYESDRFLVDKTSSENFEGI